jgi:2-amino-4-hydroxy-6-hydroxymethyldihydropteridine diphosphokinase
MKTIYLGLGSNIGDRESALRRALDQLEASLKILRVSPVYETEPVDCTAQPWFLNLVVEAETELFPMRLLHFTQRIERELGRIRTVPKGPRTIDIDILLYGRTVVHSATLEIPHARIADRRFVLAPLADLAPDLRHPVTHQSVRQMLDAAPPASICRLDIQLR